MQDLIDRILTVDCTPEVQIQRATARGQHKDHEVQAFIANQITREERLQATDDLIENTADMHQLIQRVEQLHQLYLSLSA